MVSNRGTVAGRRNCQSTSVETTFGDVKIHGHKELLEEDNSVLRVSAPLITYFITEIRTLTSVNLTMEIHRMERSKKLIDMLHKFFN